MAQNVLVIAYLGFRIIFSLWLLLGTLTVEYVDNETRVSDQSRCSSLLQ